MSDHDQILDTLISLLQEFRGDHYVSERSAEKDGGYLAPGPIEEDWPELYAAMQALEEFYSSELPWKAWEYWDDLLHFSRESDDDTRSAKKAYVAANNLLDWAKEEREAKTKPRQHGDGPVANQVGVVYWNGQRFTLSRRNWEVACCLWGKDEGVPFLDMERKIWGQETKQSTIRSAISRLDKQLLNHNILWRAVSLREVGYLEITK